MKVAIAKNGMRPILSIKRPKRRDVNAAANPYQIRTEVMLSAPIEQLIKAYTQSDFIYFRFLLEFIQIRCRINLYKLT